MSDMRLVRLSLPVFQALAAEDVPLAESLLEMPIHPQFAERTEIWEFMAGLLTDRPDDADWAMNAVVVDAAIIGNAGFKGGPGESGEVEVGYSISPSFRRRGHAVRAVRLLLERCTRDPKVVRVIARIQPDNEASVGVVTKAGFVADGDFQNPRWGRQLQFAFETPAAGR